MSKLIYIILPMLFFGSNLKAQLFKKKINQLDQGGLRTGIWRTYWDDEKKLPMSFAHFEKGRETGVCKEFRNDGSLRLKSRYDQTRIKIKYYDEKRKLEKKGWAIINYTTEDIHFYWQGKWKFFNKNHKLIKTCFYENGQERLTIIK